MPDAAHGGYQADGLIGLDHDLSLRRYFFGLPDGPPDVCSRPRAKVGGMIMLVLTGRPTIAGIRRAAWRWRCRGPGAGGQAAGERSAAGLLAGPAGRARTAATAHRGNAALPHLDLTGVLGALSVLLAPGRGGTPEGGTRPGEPPGSRYQELRACRVTSARWYPGGTRSPKGRQSSPEPS